MYVSKGLRKIRELRECAATTFKKRGINVLEFLTKRNDEERIVPVGTIDVAALEVQYYFHTFLAKHPTSVLAPTNLQLKISPRSPEPSHRQPTRHRNNGYVYPSSSAILDHRLMASFSL